MAIASSTNLASDAGARIASVGGNAVDAAIAAAWVGAIAEPGICGPGAGGFVTVWQPDGVPVIIDGYIAMPGRGLPPERLGEGTTKVFIGYGGGVTMHVGHGSVGTPGGPAALAAASERFGRVPWSEVLEPAIDIATEGFPLSPAARHYLEYAGVDVFGWHPDSHAALHDSDGRLKDQGDRIRVDHLAGSLELIARNGVEEFYTGDIGHVIAADMGQNGGLITLEDLAEYRPIIRQPLVGRIGSWRVATNPPPAIGGVVLCAMLGSMDGRPSDPWTERDVAHLVDVQTRVLGFRRERVDTRADVEAAIEELRLAFCSPSTIHTSAVDASGLACSITLSAGYGSGVMTPGTGLWLNNCLGEIELNRRGLHAWPVGSRLVSNMAPSVAWDEDGEVIAIGTPGGDRIPTAMLQVLTNHASAGMTLQEAVDHPRLHIEATDEGPGVVSEPGIPRLEVGMPWRSFDDLSMYFGGVGVASWSPSEGLRAAADPRRAGAVAISGLEGD